MQLWVRKMDNELEQVVQVLEELNTDITVPQNVRNKVQNMILVLQDPAVDKAIVISKIQDELEDISNDVNVPSDTRMRIMSVSSLLEIIC